MKAQSMLTPAADPSENSRGSRRDFFKTGLLAGGALFLPQSPEPEHSLPAPIEGLTSMRGAVRPISKDEYHERVERARALMANNRLGAIVVAGGSSFLYFANVRWHGGERLTALILPAKGEPFLVTPYFEERRLREQLAKGPFDGDSADVRTWHEDDNPYKLVAQGLRDRGISTATVGMEEQVPFMFSDGIAQALPTVKVVSATPVTAGCRMTKSPAELELMKLANQGTLLVYRTVYQVIKPGMTQNEVRRLIAAAYARVGFEGEASVQVGKYTALPHGSMTPQTIDEGTTIMVDDGCTVEGYCSDITRTFVIGKATEKQKAIFDVVKRAQKAALDAARPGTACEKVDAAARKVIDDAGYGPGYQFFTHRVGHGIGLDGHEWPYLVRGNTLALARGMTFSDEPGIYIPGEFGVRLEDDMYITAEGAEMFTRPSPSIEDPFAQE